MEVHTLEDLIPNSKENGNYLDSLVFIFYLKDYHMLLHRDLSILSSLSPECLDLFRSSFTQSEKNQEISPKLLIAFTT